MKLHTTPMSLAELHNTGEAKQLTIKTSAKAFSILSSGLYSNKIRAIIRELCCNAIDAIKASGKEGKFYLHLPTLLEPWFSVRDEGIGLSHEDMMTVYTTYFESTKTDSNEFTGALGLGAKSPFCYTSNFTVTSIKNGLKSIYTAFIDDTGVPTLVLMDKANTDESNGLEVKFQVEEKDFSTFEKEALEILPWLDISPEVNTSLKYTHYSDVYTPVDGCESVLSSTQFHPYGKGYALMGNVLYLIDEYALYPKGREYFTEKELLKKFLFKFDIGELDIQASREALSYIPATIQAIKDKVNKLKDALINKLGRRYEELNKDVFLLHFLDFNPVVNIIWEDFLQTFNIQDFKQYIKIYPEDLKKFNLVWDAYINPINTPKKYQKTPIQERVCPIEVMLTPHRIFYINDQCRTTKLYSVFAEHLENPTYRQHTELFAKYDVKPKGIVLKPLDPAKPVDIEGFKKFYSIPDYICFTVSELDSKTKKFKTISTDSEKYSKVLNRHINFYSKSSRKSSQRIFKNILKSAETLYYLPSSVIDEDRIKLKNFKPFFVGYSLRDFIKNLDNSKIIPDLDMSHVCIIPEDFIPFIKDKNNWININTVLEDNLKTLLKNHSHVLGLNKAVEKDKLSLSPIEISYSLKKVLETSDSPVSKIFKPYLDEANNLETLGIHWKINYIFGHYLKAQKYTEIPEVLEYEKLIKEQLKKYPLLFNNRDLYLTKPKDCHIYIQAIDLFYNNQ